MILSSLPVLRSRSFWTVALVVIFSSGCVSSGKYKDLQKEHELTSAQLKATLEKEQADQAQMGEQKNWIAELETKVGRGTSDRKQLEASLAETRKALEEAKQRRLESEKRIAEYTDLTRRFKSLVDAGRLSVKIVDGRMVVALSSDVLFPSGSSRLSKEGETSIREVAQLLSAIPDRKYQVEGHTDNLPIHNQQFPSNWELASARALNVTRAMLDAGMAAQRVSAASFGDTKPARSNETSEGRAANRRIEIVIVPDLSSLPGFDQLQRMSGSGSTGS
jgi:chemotaxis protein MotB